jgi:hypothetical protein
MPGVQTGPAPLAIMSFNRPDYLVQVLDSLRAQPGIEQRDIFLFQDGGRHAVTEIQHAKPEQIAACVAAFRQAFPHGRVMRARSNLGVAGNFHRAETFLFREMGADCAYLFEDDLVLSPRYLATLDRMREAAEASGEVGYFACYGKLNATEEEQRRDPAQLQALAHLWGFGLFRAHWEAMQPEMVEYYDIVLGRDYRSRPHAEILQAYREREILVSVSSQDDVKKAVTYALGKVALNTTLVHARYIGEQGLHSDPERFRRNGFDRTVILDLEQPPIAMPDRAALDDLRAAERAWRSRKIEREAKAASVGPQVGPSSMTPEERALFERTVAGRRRYAEFGSGGSTPLALKLGVGTLVSVESDPTWARAVRAVPLVARAIAEGRASVLHADIGTVGAWGAPASREPTRLWPRYVAAMWHEWARRGAFPDAVLVDGRFRVACCLSVALLHAARPGSEPPVVMLRDYSDRRPGYAVVLEAFRVREQAGELCVMVPRENVAPESLLALMVERVTDPG